jgi:hypothetical protein
LFFPGLASGWLETCWKMSLMLKARPSREVIIESPTHFTISMVSRSFGPKRSVTVNDNIIEHIII